MPGSSSARSATVAPAQVRSAGGSPDAGPRRVRSRRDEIYEGIAHALSERGDDSFSRAICTGSLDPQEVVDWVRRCKKLVLYKCERESLRVEVPAVGDGLIDLLRQVELPEGADPETLALEFVARLPEIRGHLADDTAAAYDGDPAARSFAEIVASYPSLRALAVHRIAHVLHQQKIPLLPRIASEYAHDRTGIDIHPGASIGRSFFIDHGTGVVIGETAVIGNHVRLYQGVTLGAKSLPHRENLVDVKRHPTIEDDVIIYAGATILGGETVIGKGSIIGGNVWLTESVPPGSRVLAEAPRQQVRRSGEADSEAPLHWEI